MSALAEHVRAACAAPRPAAFDPMPLPRFSPWGAIVTAVEAQPGIWWVQTDSHGGFLISHQRWAAMPEHLRAVPTFAGNPEAFEEDCDWCLVVLAFPAEFPHEQRGALITLRNLADLAARPSNLVRAGSRIRRDALAHAYATERAQRGEA